MGQRSDLVGTDPNWRKPCLFGVSQRGSTAKTRPYTRRRNRTEIFRYVIRTRNYILDQLVTTICLGNVILQEKSSLGQRSDLVGTDPNWRKSCLFGVSQRGSTAKIRPYTRRRNRMEIFSYVIRPRNYIFDQLVTTICHGNATLQEKSSLGQRPDLVGTDPNWRNRCNKRCPNEVPPPKSGCSPVVVTGWK